MPDSTEDSTPKQAIELGDALSPTQAAFLLSIGVIDKSTAARAFGFPDDFAQIANDHQDGHE